MSTILFSDKTLRALSTQQDVEEIVDSEFRHGEFGLTVRKSGRKTFFLRYRVGKKRKRMTLGTYPVITLAQARAKALKCVLGVQQGDDPARTRQEKRHAETIGDLFEQFMTQKSNSYAVTTYRNYWSMWRKDCKAALSDVRIEEIERRDIVDLLDTIEARTVNPHMVNRTRTLLMTFFNWAVAKDRCKYNPAIGVPKAQKREMPSERFLSRDEIRIYWQCTGQLPAREGVYWRLLLLLAMRPGEVAMLRYNWIDGEVLTIPASFVKNRREHKLYLTDVTRSLIRSMPQFEHSEYLFPSPVGPSHQRNFRESYLKLAKAMDIPHWTPRDIRRTCETQMRTFIRDGEGISRVLNHDISAIRKHYDRGDYFERKAEVLTKWTLWLTDLTGPTPTNGNVTNLFDYRRTKQEVANVFS